MTPACLSASSIRAFIIHVGVPLLLVCAFTATLSAQGNPKISIQGTLKSASGASVADGEYAVRFNLYTTPIGGAPVWFEDTLVDVIGSIYSHYLGSVTPLDPADFGNTLYLGVKVGSYELVPRSELAYAPYSFSVAVAQKVLCSGAVGDIKYSILNPTQFDAENGDCWVPMDGRALATTDKLRQITDMTNVPNGSGLFLRAQEFSGGPDNDPGRTSGTTVGTLQQDDFESHNHTMGNAGNHNHNMGTRGFAGNGLKGADGSFDDSDSSTQYAGDHTHPINNTGGNETRPKNLNFWVYIRIN